jgi:N-acetylmuramoyl-L-alanine amidase
MRPINKIIIHCSATPEGRDVKIDTIRQWHLDKGWNDIGYHYVIELDGQIQAGRPVELLGSHCLGQNKFSIGICYVGGMNKSMSKAKDTRTPDQKESLIKLIADLRKKFPNLEIHGHNEYSAKACPSFNVANEGY